MDIAPIILKDKVRCVPGHTLFSFNQKTKEIKRAEICRVEYETSNHF